MDVVSVTVRVVTALLGAVATLELGPAAGVGLPDLVTPADVHHAEASRHREGIAVVIGREEPLEERLCLGVLLGDLGVDHPVERAAFLVLAATTGTAVSRDPDAAGVGVRRANEVGDALRARLRRRVADVLPLVGREGIHLGRQAVRHDRGRRERDLLLRLVILLVFLSVRLLLCRRARIAADR